ncbi:MAG: trans-sulfuration enzyme family protein [Candidatus Hodarchaeota archaeon]
MQLTDKGFNTQAVHAGGMKELPADSIVPAIYETSVFRFSKTQELIDVISEEADGFIYSRFNNPTVKTTESKLTVLEGSEDAALFSSGMAAISTVLLTLLSSGDHVVATRDIYGGTLVFFMKVLPKFGIKVSLAEATDINGIIAAVQEKTKAIFVETPTNPTLKIVDLQKIAELGKDEMIPVMVDNTFATPYNSRPIQFGMDIVIHSATKYLGGHHDLTAGVVCGSANFIQQLKAMRKSLGGTLDPVAAWLLLRGLKTLGLRMERHNSNGMAIAKFLTNHPKVRQVYYPGLTKHPQHALAKQQMQGFGGVVSFEINGNMKTAMNFVENLQLCQLAASLGGTETLATQPVTSSHYAISPEDRQKAGITDQLVRLALGIEDPEDIIEDLEQAFNKI